MLRVPVVKSVIVADDDKLRISFIILQTSYLVSLKVDCIHCFGAPGDGPSAEYATGWSTVPSY